MIVLVTGAGGFLGSAVVRRLIEHGTSVVRCLVRQPAQVRALELLGSESGTRVECHLGDLRARAVLERALDGVDTVYHLAAAMKGSFSEMVMGTVVGSKYLAEAIASAAPGSRIVLVSSFAVYGTAALPAGALVDEATALEPWPAQRGGYCWSKLRQERLFEELAKAIDSPLVVMRPGVVYGPGGAAFSPRVGVQLPGLFLHLGDGNIIPLTYVDNCAEGIVVAGTNAQGSHNVYNVVDDDPVTSSEYLRSYRRQVRRIRYLSVPYPLMRVVASGVQKYNEVSRGQLPAFFTSYKTRTNWKGCTFSNARLKSIGWNQVLSTEEGMRRTFTYMREHPEGRV